MSQLSEAKSSHFFSDPMNPHNLYISACYWDAEAKKTSPSDPTKMRKAVTLLDRAAQLGHYQAQNALGMLLIKGCSDAQGEYLPANVERAWDMLSAAAEAVPMAKYNKAQLAEMIFNNEAGRKEISSEDIYQLYKAAAASGVIAAQQWLDATVATATVQPAAVLVSNAKPENKKDKHGKDKNKVKPKKEQKHHSKTEANAAFATFTALKTQFLGIPEDLVTVFSNLVAAAAVARRCNHPAIPTELEFLWQTMLQHRDASLFNAFLEQDLDGIKKFDKKYNCISAVIMKTAWSRSEKNAFIATLQQKGFQPLHPSILFIWRNDVSALSNPKKMENVNLPDAWGFGLMHYAVMSQRPDVIAKLQQTGRATVNDRAQPSQTTPLILAAQHDFLDVAKKLRNLGAAVGYHDSQGKSASDYAKEQMKSYLGRSLEAPKPKKEETKGGRQDARTHKKQRPKPKLLPREVKQFPPSFSAAVPGEQANLAYEIACEYERRINWKLPNDDIDRAAEWYKNAFDHGHLLAKDAMHKILLKCFELQDKNFVLRLLKTYKNLYLPKKGLLNSELLRVFDAQNEEEWSSDLYEEFITLWTRILDSDSSSDDEETDEALFKEFPHPKAETKSTSPTPAAPLADLENTSKQLELMVEEVSRETDEFMRTLLEAMEAGVKADYLQNDSLGLTSLLQQGFVSNIGAHTVINPEGIEKSSSVSATPMGGIDH